MTREMLRQSDSVLSKCGRPLPPAPGARVVPIAKSFKCWAVFAAPPFTNVATIPTQITGDVTWMFRALSSYVTIPVGLSLQFQFPDGRFLFHGPSDIRCVAGFGSQRFVLTKERACPPGTKIVATFNDTTPLVAQAVPLLLEGAYYYHVSDVGGHKQVQLESSTPRYVWRAGIGRGAPGANQNILAPCWAFGEGPETPQGCKDDAFTYSSLPQSNEGELSVAIDVGVGTPKNAALNILIEQGSDFVVRNLWFNVFTDSGVTGFNVLVKVRDTSGYDLTDDYVEYGALNGIPQLKDWIVAAGNTIIFDLALVDYSGAGNVYVQTFANGAKRRRA